MIMRDTIFCAIPADADTDAIAESIHKREKEIQAYAGLPAAAGSAVRSAVGDQRWLRPA